MSYDFAEQLRAGKAGEAKLNGLWKSARIVDRILEMQGRRIPVEYKADFIAHRTGNLVFEVVSVDRTGAPGWGLSSKAEYLVYLLAETSEVYLIRLSELRRWVLERASEFREVSADNGSYRTLSLLVPLRELERQSFVKKLAGPVKKVSEKEKG